MLGTMRNRPRIASIFLAGALLTACGGASTADTPPKDEAPARTAAATPDPAARPVTDCTAQGRVVIPASTATARARRRIDTAAIAARRAGHRFTTLLDVRAAGLRASARIQGRRLPTGASVASLTWDGAAGILLPDLQLRVVDDHLYLLREDRETWRALGSASGVALDVGRELLDHPFLLDATAARGDARHVALDLVAPPARLREFATTERRGPVTDLLAGTRRLTLTAHATGRRLAGDDFTLVTRVPASLELPGIRTGTGIAITGASFYCPLRGGASSTDRSPISAPSVTS